MPTSLVQKYNPKWPVWFAKIRDRLEKSLAGTYVEIEHVGSTAVPGMTAKPIIDLDVIIISLARFLMTLPLSAVPLPEE